LGNDSGVIAGSRGIDEPPSARPAWLQLDAGAKIEAAIPAEAPCNNCRRENAALEEFFRDESFILHLP
jgi:hypothetical protein